MLLRPCLTFAAAMGAALALAGCNETNGAGMSPETSVAAAPGSSFHVPPGAPCSSEINHYESVVKDDLQTGNVEQKVYDQIQKELARAAAACSAGRGSEAHSIVAGSKAKHGYRA